MNLWHNLCIFILICIDDRLEWNQGDEKSKGRIVKLEL